MEKMNFKKPYGVIHGGDNQSGARYVQDGQTYNHLGEPVKAVEVIDPRTNNKANEGLPPPAPSGVPPVSAKPSSVTPPYERFSVQVLRHELSRRLDGKRILRSSKKPQLIHLLEEYDTEHPSEPPGTVKGPHAFS